MTQFCRSFIKFLGVVLPIRLSHTKDIYTYNFPDDGRRFKYLSMCALDMLCSSH